MGGRNVNLKECYEIIGDYNDVMLRIPMEKLIKKCICKFPGDPSYMELSNAIKAEDYKEAFRAVHTLKGVSRNLGLMTLFNLSDQMTEILRDEKAHDVSDLMNEIDLEYEKVVAAISQLINDEQ